MSSDFMGRGESEERAIVERFKLCREEIDTFNFIKQYIISHVRKSSIIHFEWTKMCTRMSLVFHQFTYTLF